METDLIKKIKGGIVGIKNGTKEPKDIGSLLRINEPMYDEILIDYKKALELRKK